MFKILTLIVLIAAYKDTILTYAIWIFYAILGFLIFLWAWELNKKKKEEDRIAAMTPEEREQYELDKKLKAEDAQRKIHEEVFGPINYQLICPHCQNKGTVRANNKKNMLTTSGTVGGVIKTNTASTITQNVTQHHCDNCGSTWNI